MPYFNYNGIKIYYRRLGVKTNLPHLIFIHGAFANHLTWYAQIKFFSNITEVSVLDLPGHGRSAKPKIEYTLNFFANILQKIMEELEILKPILIGHSLGGFIVQTAALKYPEQIQKLVLLCTGVYGGLWGKKLRLPYHILLVLRRILSKFSWSLFCKILSNLTAKHKIKGIEGIKLESRMATSCSGKVFLNIMFHLLGSDLSDAVKSIKIPILFISGTKDLFYHQAPIYHALPNAIVKIKAGGEHILHLLNEDINGWIFDFIKDVN